MACGERGVVRKVRRSVSKSSGDSEGVEVGELRDWEG